MSETCILCQRIWTGFDHGEIANAMIFSERGIAAVGDIRDVEKHPLYANSRVVRVDGVIIPGLSDSHLHLQAYAKQKLFADLSKVKNKKEMLSILKTAGEKSAPNDWVCGFNFNEASWEYSLMPNRKDLDSLDLPNPVLIQRICTHATVLNSKAMTLCSLDEGGSTEGIVFEDAQAVAHSKMSADTFTRERLLSVLKEGLDECASYGLSTLYVCGAKSLGMEENMDLYQELRARGELKARIFTFIDEETIPRMSTGYGDRWIGYQGYKVFIDGSLGARTAALSSPYSDAEKERGMLLYKTEVLAELLAQLDSINCQALVHTIGDAALDQLLDAFETSQKGKPPREKDAAPPLVINHCMICRPEQIQRIKDLGAAVTMQPTFVPSDRLMAPLRLGERIDKGWAYPWKSIVDAGITMNGSSDCPIESLNPWDGIWAAVNRKTEAGCWMPQQCLSVEEALRIYTVNPATCMGSGGWRGTLEDGKEADFVVIDRDIFSCPQGEREGVRVLCTVVGGKVAYGELGV